MKFLNPKPEELLIYVYNHIVDLHKLWVPSRLYRFPLNNLRFTIILISSKFSMNFCKNNENAAILKILKISKNCHGRITANYSKFLSSI